MVYEDNCTVIYLLYRRRSKKDRKKITQLVNKIQFSQTLRNSKKITIKIHWLNII